MSLPFPLLLILSAGIPTYILLFVVVMFVMWRIYIKVGRMRCNEKDTDEYGLTEEFGPDYLMNNLHQDKVAFLHEIFERSASKFPEACAVRIAYAPSESNNDSCEIEITKGGLQQNACDRPISSSMRSASPKVGDTVAEVNHVLGLDAEAEPLVHQMSVTYSTLNTLASSISQVLLTGIVGDHSNPYVSAPDQIVAVLLPRVSVHIFAAQIGALKAGAGVLMLDTNLPNSVLEFQIADSKPVAILTLDCYLKARAQRSNMTVDELQQYLFAGLGTATIDLDSLFRGCLKPNSSNSQNRSNVLSQLRPSHLAMVIYTSGTTGKPKAVLCEHAGYVNYTLDYSNYMNLVPNYDTHAQMASLSFDASLEELYGAWCVGVPLVVFTDSQIRAGPDLVPLLCNEHVTAVSLVPSLLSTISKRPERDFAYPLLRYITVGGEAITESLVEPWTRGRRELINSYGPTEATIVVCRQSLRKGEPVTIGTPVANTSLFCIDHEAINDNPAGAALALLPHGSSGELCASGIQLARGYLNRDELTNEKFVTNSGTRYGRAYRTGDLCRIDEETKCIVYQGRIDQQVKIRGNRIELGTVENALLQELSEIINEVDRVDEGEVAIARDDPVAGKQGDSLVGFLCVPNYFRGNTSEFELVPRNLLVRCQEALAKVLPPPAVPSILVFVPHLPRQVASGKINRKALPNVQETLACSSDAAEQSTGEAGTQEQSRGAVDEEEKQLLRESVVAQQCLQACREFLPTLQVMDEFTKVGADSIMIAKLVAALREFIPSVSVKDILAFKTLGKLMLAKIKVGDSEHMEVAKKDDGCGDHSSELQKTYEKSHVYHPYIFNFLQCLAIFAMVAAALFITVVETVLMLDLWEYLVTQVLPESIGDDIGLSLLVLSPFMGAVFVLVDAAFKLLIGIPLYRLLLCRLIGRCLMKLQVGSRYHKWSSMHLYLWLRLSLEQRLRSAMLFNMGDDTFSFTLRCLGGKIGSNVYYGQDMHFEGLLAEYLHIGAGSVFLDECSLVTCQLHQDYIVVAPLTIKNSVKVGARAHLGAGAIVPQGCFVDHISSIPEFFECDAENEILSGVPALPTGIANFTLPSNIQPSRRGVWERRLPVVVHTLLLMVVFAFAVLALDVFVIGVFRLTSPFATWEDFESFFGVYDHMPKPESAEEWKTLKSSLANLGEDEIEEWKSGFLRNPAEIVFQYWLPMAVYVAFVLTVTLRLIMMLLCFAFFRNPFFKIRVGCYPQRSLTGSLAKAKVKLFNIFQKEMFGHNSKSYMMVAAGCTFETSCGCSELATCQGLIPDTTLIGPNSFWADDCLCTQIDFEGHCIKVQRSRFPQNFFMGNSAVIEPGPHPTNFLVGVGTVAYGHAARRQMQTRLDKSETIFGVPPVKISSDRVARFWSEEPKKQSTSLTAWADSPITVVNVDEDAASAGGATESEGMTSTTASIGLQTHLPPKSGECHKKTDTANEATKYSDFTGKFAHEPTFAQFLFRGWLFDGSITFLKLLPMAILMTILAFWLVNDFGPVYDKISVQKKVGAKSVKGAKDFQGGKDFGGRKLEDKAQSPQAFFLATRELFLLDEPAAEMIQVHLLLSLYILIWYIAIPILFVMMKRLLVWRLKPGAYSLFANCVQRHFFIWTLSEAWMAPFLSVWSGTLTANFFYSLLGAKIGRRTLMTQVGLYGDVDQWIIGDDCVIDGYVWQSHTFEDRVFWVQDTEVGHRCFVGKDSILMGGATLGSDSHLEPLSCAWKTMKLEPGTHAAPKRYIGSPPVQRVW